MVSGALGLGKETDKRTQNVRVMRAGRRPGQSGWGWAGPGMSGCWGRGQEPWGPGGRGSSRNVMLTWLPSAAPASSPGPPLSLDSSLQLTFSLALAESDNWALGKTALNKKQTGLSADYQHLSSFPGTISFSLFHPKGKRPHARPNHQLGKPEKVQHQTQGGRAGGRHRGGRPRSRGRKAPQQGSTFKGTGSSKEQTSPWKGSEWRQVSPEESWASGRKAREPSPRQEAARVLGGRTPGEASGRGQGLGWPVEGLLPSWGPTAGA